MSFVDTVGPFVLCVLLGLSALIAALGWVFLYVAPRLRDQEELASFHRKAMGLVDDLIYEIRNNPDVLPRNVQDEIWGLKDRTLAKEINR